MERDRLGKRANRSPTIPRHITVEDERYRRHRPALFLFVGGRRHTETATARIIGQLIGLYRNDKIKYRSIYPTGRKRTRHKGDRRELPCFVLLVMRTNPVLQNDRKRRNDTIARQRFGRLSAPTAQRDTTSYLQNSFITHLIPLIQ